MLTPCFPAYLQESPPGVRLVCAGPQAVNLHTFYALLHLAWTETTNAIAVMLNSDFVLMPDYRVNLIDQLDLTRSPGFIDPRSQRPISPENDEPAFTRNGLNPISFINTFR